MVPWSAVALLPLSLVVADEAFGRTTKAVAELPHSIGHSFARLVSIWSILPTA
jgi:hypothetical protein